MKKAFKNHSLKAFKLTDGADYRSQYIRCNPHEY